MRWRTDQAPKVTSANRVGNVFERVDMSYSPAPSNKIDTAARRLGDLLDTLIGENAKDGCAAQAKGKYNVAKSEAEATYKNTPKARENARVAHAQASYDVAMKSATTWLATARTCASRKQKAEFVKGKAKAKVDRVVTDTRKDTATKQADARRGANEDKRDADYKVAIEKCDALAGPAKNTCIGNAKVQYGKS